MAQVIITDQQVISTSWREWGRTIVFGAITGLIFWLLTILLQRYIIDPLVCRQIVNATLCANSTPLAGNIAAILTGAVAVIFMVRAGIARPIILAVATAALLWDLAAWTNGLFWLEAVVWSIVLYALTYALFAWITRYATLWVTVVLSLLIVVIIRIALVL
ncbi:MAG: rane protein of unknown function [Candidatus Saccharibacteria bacterium]|nr:rane protein of unknown function [Candidatus Saccharibacteria bacterium]